MATAWGIGPDANGNGTTPEDIQRIIAAEYSNAGIIDGCDVKGAATMSYTVSAGAVILSTGIDMAVKMPVPATTVPTTAAPATGSRTDTIYVKQNLPGSDASSLVVVGVTSGALPANSIALAQYTINAGVTSTSGANQTLNRKFAVPVGSSLGRLWRYSAAASSAAQPNGVTTRGAGKVYVPTDRDVQIDMVSTARAATSSGATDAAGRGSVLYKFYVDGQHVKSWERVYERFYETKQFNFIHALPEGEHTFHYTTERQFVASGAGYWAVAKDGADKWPGDVFTVTDLGVINW